MILVFVYMKITNVKKPSFLCYNVLTFGGISVKNTNIAAVFFIPICVVAARHGD